MSEAVKSLFTDISPTYDRLNHVLSCNRDKAWRQQTIARIRQPADGEFLALDLCAGTHDLGLECLRQFPRSRIEAVDFSYGMLSAGMNKISSERAAGRLLPICGDALQLPFADATFDVIFCAYGVRNFDDAGAGLKEMCRLLKPGGQILILEFFRPTSFLNRLFSRTYGQYILPAIGRLISGHASAYAYLRDSIRGFLSLTEISDLLQSLGFGGIETRNFFMGISSCVSAFKARSE